YVVVAQGIEYTDFSKVISLNESGACLWKELEGKEFTVSDIVTLLMDYYIVDEATALRDGEAFFHSMKQAHII
ncbi:MAG: PqqD family protein, partial [Bacteroidales bacterium]